MGPGQPGSASRADCEARLPAAEKLLEDDGYYAEAWRNTWNWAGVGFIGLNLTTIGHYSDYRRTESIVRAVSSLLVFIAQPEALDSRRTLQGIRASASVDPCLALTHIRDMLVLEDVDYKEQTGLVTQLITIGVPIITGAIVAAAVKHWDFAGPGSEGVETLVSIGIGELQAWTFPRSSLKASATSLQLSF